MKKSDGHDRKRARDRFECRAGWEETDAVPEVFIVAMFAFLNAQAAVANKQQRGPGLCSGHPGVSRLTRWPVRSFFQPVEPLRTGGVGGKGRSNADDVRP